MMKKKYEKIEVEVVLLDSLDVLTSSINTNGENDDFAECPVWF